MKIKTQNISRLIRKYVNYIDPNTDVILYGSRARGDERENSDWDILILTNYPTDLGIESKFRDKLYELELETGKLFSVFAYSKNNWHSKQKITPFYENVTQEGISLVNTEERAEYENLFNYDKESVEPLLKSSKEMIKIIDTEIKNAL